MPSKWLTRKLGQVIIQVFALTATWPRFTGSENLYEIKFISTDGSRKAMDTILISPEQCIALETFWPDNMSLVDTEGNCLELWSKKDCGGNMLYYVSSADDGVSNLPWAKFPAKSVKLCEAGKQPSHHIVRRSLVENSTEYYFWFSLSKVRGRLVVFLEEFRKGDGHPDWEMIMGGRNWQGPRSKMYLKALHKVINVFKTFCDMDMKWSRYSTEDLENLKKLAADVVRLREIKTLEFPHTDPQSRVHAKIVKIWKNITITLDKAYETKLKYDEEVKLGKSKKQFGQKTAFGVSLKLNLPTLLNERNVSTIKTTVVDVTSMTMITTASVKKSSLDESVIRIID